MQDPESYVNPHSLPTSGASLTGVPGASRWEGKEAGSGGASGPAPGTCSQVGPTPTLPPPPPPPPCSSQ